MERRHRTAMIRSAMERLYDKIQEALQGNDDALEALQRVYDYHCSVLESRGRLLDERKAWTELAMKPLREMTEQERRKLLDKYYREPVKPLSEFCHAMTLWFRAIEQKYERETGVSPDKARFLHNTDRETPDTRFHGGEYAPLLSSIEIDIMKSGLLARLMYGDETELRTEMCPDHEGEMAMRVWMGVEKCDHGCEGTGWLPND